MIIFLSLFKGVDDVEWTLRQLKNNAFEITYSISESDRLSCIGSTSRESHRLQALGQLLAVGDVIEIKLALRAAPIRHRADLREKGEYCLPHLHSHTSNLKVRLICSYLFQLSTSSCIDTIFPFVMYLDTANGKTV